VLLLLQKKKKKPKKTKNTKTNTTTKTTPHKATHQGNVSSPEIFPQVPMLLPVLSFNSLKVSL